MKKGIKIILLWLLTRALYFARIMLYPPDHLHAPQEFEKKKQ